MAREKRMEVRVDAAEKKRIAANAKEAGFESVGDYMRTMALQPSLERAKAEPGAGARTDTPCPHTTLQDISNGTTIVNAGQCAGCGAIVKIDPDRGIHVDLSDARPDVEPRTAAEIAEAKLKEDPAREAFIERRTRELHGQGRTTPVARREAEAEWRAR